MRFRIYSVLAVTVAVLWPAGAGATTVTPPASTFAYQAWADEALVPGPPSLEVVESATACSSGAAACSSEGWPIYLGPYTLAAPIPDARQIFYHEEGHHFDYDVMPDWARARFEWLVGDYRPWMPPVNTPQPNSPHEKFAEAWATCALHATLRHVPRITGYGYRPTPRLHRKVCRMIATVGAEAGL